VPLADWLIVRSFADPDTLVGAVPFAIVRDLRTIDSGRGSEDLYRHKLPALLTALADRARVASIEASSAIEGVVVQDRARAADIVAGTAAELRDRSEQELAGYRATLDYLYQEQWRPLNVGLLLHLHRLLFQYTQNPGGQLKQVENVVVDKMPDGTRAKRFTPVSVAQTPYYVDELISRYLAVQRAGRHHPVISIGLFVLARSADAYYAALLASTAGWHDQAHDPWPWLRYFVGLVAESYDTFATLTASARSGGSKQDRVRDYVLNHAPATFQIADIRAALPGVSDPTIRLALGQLKADGRVEPDSVGRSATWTRRTS